MTDQLNPRLLFRLPRAQPASRLVARLSRLVRRRPSTMRARILHSLKRRCLNSTSKHLKEMEYEFKTVKQDVIFRSKEGELAKAVEPLGLKPLMAPPFRIVDTLVEK